MESIKEFGYVILVLVNFAVLGYGVFGYKSLRLKWSGILGVGRSYIILLGVMAALSAVGGLIGMIGKMDSAPGIGEILVLIVVAAICGVVYLGAAASCETTGQKIGLLFAAIFIAYGWMLRFIWALITRAPMYDPADDIARQQAAEEAERAALEARREAVKSEAMKQFDVQGSDVTVNSTGDMVKVNGEWVPVKDR